MPSAARYTPDGMPGWRCIASRRVPETFACAQTGAGVVAYTVTRRTGADTPPERRTLALDSLVSAPGPPTTEIVTMAAQPR